MKKIYEQNIIKKTYHKPVIEEVILDKEMSLVMGSPDTGDDGEFPEPPDDQNNVTSGYKSLQSPDYGSDTYKSARSPFD